MDTVNIHEAKTHLSRLLARVAAGESITISRAGTPVARIVPLHAPEAAATHRLGFLEGQIAVPDDFDRMGAEIVEALFGGTDGRD